MKLYTYEEFSARHGLTLTQSKFNAIRGKFDTVKILQDTMGNRGGARWRRFIKETPRTLERVERLKVLDRAGIGYNLNMSKTITLHNGMEVLNNLLGKVMLGGEDSIKYERVK